MEEKIVVLPQPIEDEAVAVLESAGLKLKVAEAPKPEVVGPMLKGAHAIVLRTGIKVTKELLESADELLTISRTGAGVDNVDLDAATEKGIVVSSSLGVNTSSVAEHCLAMMMSLFKQFPLLDREVRNNNFAVRYKNLPADLQGKTLGLVGFGRIGSTLGKWCNSMFSMKVVANDEYLPEHVKAEYKDWVRFTGLDEVAAESDVISIHIPMNSETAGMFNSGFFAKMKKTAFLINTSRGGVVNEKDLIDALKKKVIAGAGLDVFEKEPIEQGNELLKLDNVILTPHTAALTEECVIRMAVSGAERVVSVLKGERPENVANPEVLKQPKWKKFS